LLRIDESGRLLDSPIWKITGFINPEDYRIHQSGRLLDSPIQKITGFTNPECKKINADFLFCKITELHCPEEERVV